MTQTGLRMHVTYQQPFHCVRATVCVRVCVCPGQDSRAVLSAMSKNAVKAKTQTWQQGMQVPPSPGVAE